MAGNVYILLQVGGRCHRRGGFCINVNVFQKEHKAYSAHVTVHSRRDLIHMLSAFREVKSNYVRVAEDIYAHNVWEVSC